MEDKIFTVPYPKDPDKNVVFTCDNSIRKTNNQDANTTATSTGQTSGSKNEHLVPIFEMDTWSSSFFSNSELSSRKFPSVHAESKLFGNICEDKECDNLLGCNWDNIDAFDDINWIFRDESIFGHNMIANEDDLLPSISAVTGNTAQSIPISVTPSCSYQNQGCSSSRSVEHFCGKGKAKDKDDERSKNKAPEIFSGTWPDKNIGQTQQFRSSAVPHFDVTPTQSVPAFAQYGCSSFAQYEYSEYPFPMNKELDNLERISTLSGDNTENTVYYQLQDAVRKLNTRTRLCMGDSLLRLARSSIGRQSTSEINTTNKTPRDVVTGGNQGGRHTAEETCTNPVDRTVAHLLFQKPSQWCTIPMN